MYKKSSSRNQFLLTRIKKCIRIKLNSAKGGAILVANVAGLFKVMPITLLIERPLGVAFERD